MNTSAQGVLIDIGKLLNLFCVTAPDEPQTGFCMHFARSKISKLELLIRQSSSFLFLPTDRLVSSRLVSSRRIKWLRTQLIRRLITTNKPVRDMSRQWTPNQSKELARLSPKEDDWTQIAGLGNDATPRKRVRKKRKRHGDSPEEQKEVESPDPEFNPSSSDSEDSDDDDDDFICKEVSEKPSESRVMLEVESTRKFVLDLCNLKECPTCKSPIDVDFKTVTITTNLGLKCLNPDCDWCMHSDPCATTTLHENKEDETDHKRMTDHALNVLFILSFVMMGDGGTEAGKLLGLLGLPNDTTMEKRSFSMIEDRLIDTIAEITTKVLEDNIIDEVRASNSAEVYKRWYNSQFGDSDPLDDSDCPIMDASFDEGWQQKKSGHTRDSPSGHGLMFGDKIRNALVLQIKSKLCRLCWARQRENDRRAKRNEELPPEEQIELLPLQHEGRCWKNWTHSSGAMEATTCLENIMCLYDKYQVKVGKIAPDDDASTRAMCVHPNNVWKEKNPGANLPTVEITKGPSKGEYKPRPDSAILPRKYHEPLMVADIK